MNFTGPQAAGGGLPGVTAPIASFAVGDGGDGVPVNGQTQLRVVTLMGQNIVNKQLLVLRSGIELMYAGVAGDPPNIFRYNDGTLGGFDMNTAPGVSPGSFVQDEKYDVFITGENFTIEP